MQLAPIQGLFRLIPMPQVEDYGSQALTGDSQLYKDISVVKSMQEHPK